MASFLQSVHDSASRRQHSYARVCLTPCSPGRQNASGWDPASRQLQQLLAFCDPTTALVRRDSDEVRRIRPDRLQNRGWPPTERALQWMGANRNSASPQRELRRSDHRQRRAERSRLALSFCEWVLVWRKALEIASRA